MREGLISTTNPSVDLGMADLVRLPGNGTHVLECIAASHYDPNRRVLPVENVLAHEKPLLFGVEADTCARGEPQPVRQEPVDLVVEVHPRHRHTQTRRIHALSHLLGLITLDLDLLAPARRPQHEPPLGTPGRPDVLVMASMKEVLVVRDHDFARKAPSHTSHAHAVKRKNYAVLGRPDELILFVRHHFEMPEVGEEVGRVPKVHGDVLDAMHLWPHDLLRRLERRTGEPERSLELADEPACSRVTLRGSFVYCCCQL